MDRVTLDLWIVPRPIKMLEDDFTGEKNGLAASTTSNAHMRHVVATSATSPSLPGSSHVHASYIKYQWGMGYWWSWFV